MLRKKEHFLGLIILLSLSICPRLFSYEPRFDFSLVNFGSGGYIIFANMPFSQAGFIKYSPTISFKYPSNWKIYFGGEVKVGPGFLSSLGFGIGKEIPLNDFLSVEPLGMINFGTYYAGSSGDNYLFGIQGLCRLNLLFNKHIKLFFETGLNSYVLYSSRAFQPYESYIFFMELLAAGIGFSFSL